MNKLLIIFSLFCFSAFSQNPVRVAIIGGGMAGVSAAHHILALNENTQITIFEKESELGGNARTITLQNNFGDSVTIDAGPQYFEDQLWANYINFLKSYKLFNDSDIYQFAASAVIENETHTVPDFITPKGLHFRGGKFSKLMQFLKFFKAARKVYLDKIDYQPSIGDWIAGLSLKENFKSTVALPFLASTLGTSVLQIKTCATKDIVKLFASQKALKKSDFKVFKNGMGTLIQAVGIDLEHKGVVVLRNTAVFGLRKNEADYSIFYDTKEQHFDFVVFATHPYQAAKIIENVKQFDEITTVLNKFHYFKTTIVLHRDSSFVDNNKASFLNVKTDSTHEVISSTMNLGIVNPAWEGLYKSWLNDTDIEKVKNKGAFIHQEIFYHPLITPVFHEYLEVLRKYTVSIPTIYFAGGWSEGLETQETAVNSGEKAADKLKIYLSSIHKK